MIIPINKPLLAKIQSIQNSAPQKTPLTAELVKAQSRIIQLEAENKALRTRPLAIAPKVPLMPSGKVDSLAVTRIQMRLEKAEAKAASDAVFTKCTPKKTILNPSKYRA